MPAGVPVATVALNGAKNAGVLAGEIIGAFDPLVSARVTAYKKQLEQEVLSKVDKLKEAGWGNTFDQ